MIDPSALSTGSSKCRTTCFGECSTTRSRGGSVSSSVEWPQAAGASASVASRASSASPGIAGRRSNRIRPSFGVTANAVTRLRCSAEATGGGRGALSVPERQDRRADEYRRLRSWQQYGRPVAERPAEGEPAGQGAAEPEAEGVEGACEQQRCNGERQLQRQADEEGGLDHQVERNRAGPRQPFGVLLDREGERGQQREEENGRTCGSIAAHALADAQHQ